MKLWLHSVWIAMATQAFQRWLLYLVAAGVLSTAVLMWLIPRRAGQAAVAVGRVLIEAWPSMLLVAVAVLIAAAARSRGTAQRTGQGPQLPLLVHVALLLGLAIGVAFGLGTLLWTAVGRPALTGSPSAPAPAPNVSGPPGAVTAASGWTLTNTFDAMKIVLAVVGGVGGVVALTVAYRRQHLGEAAEHREESKERRENTKLFNERFTKAVELVGSDKAAVRLAGVYAVANLANDWPGGRQMCVDVLCAYLRMPYTPPVAAKPAGEPAAAPAEDVTDSVPVGTSGRDPYEERQVRHTVIRLIRDHLRLPTTNPHSWQGRDLDFTGAVFDGGDFSRVHFSGGMVSFAKATFSAGAVSFAKAVFSGGEVTFEGARFFGGMVSFAEATFSGGEVAFEAARFCGSEVLFQKAAFSDGLIGFGRAVFSDGAVDFADATFSGGEVFLGQAVVSGGDLIFVDTLFDGCKVSFDFTRFSGGRVYFEGACFRGTVSFQRARFVGGLVDLKRAIGDVRPTFSFNNKLPNGLLLPDRWLPPSDMPLPVPTP
ncbi:pentapeptide repeat-containing protein [Micromonospora sp. LH3U1]|uniref:pentapeptide repeat-containing protein n=1 Tax=Micromonospora sp. LH3U1 TaxID=3018339 RepID=UPI00234BDFCE|nr:pentapeptide repeat-containing protein [Micromonospora sp. LH3U1]WCN79661.1 pentapeptide repeat-containing protein [Micromonospora sp. LH3U1]